MDMAIRLAAPGGVEGLQLIDWPPQSPGPGEIRLRHAAIGLNFIDVYHRTGLYPLPSLCIPGVEGAGVVEALGDGVIGLTVGDRIAYAGAAGAYAPTRILPAWRAIRLPADVSSECAAASMLRGLTAHMLLTRTYPVSAGSTLLVHAVAGGLGTVLTCSTNRARCHAICGSVGW